MQEDLDFNDSTRSLEIRGSYFYFTDIGHVASYPPNPYGLHNIVGNVSEMIQEEGVAMGGDWMTTGYKITTKKKYEKGGAAWIGFRVYMEIIEF